MKTFKQVLNEIKKTAEKIQRAEKQLDVLTLADELKNAANISELREIHERANLNADKIAVLCNRIYKLKVEKAVLAENMKAAIVADALPIIAAAVAPYNGKQYGEKTREKIYKTVENAGFYFYFSGAGLNGEKKYISISPINDNGYHYGGRDFDAECYCIDYQKPFVTAENVLQFDVENVKTGYKYAENVSKQAGAIIKAYNAHKIATEKAEKTARELNDILPENMGSFHNINYIKSLVY